MRVCRSIILCLSTLKVGKTSFFSSNASLHSQPSTHHTCIMGYTWFYDDNDDGGGVAELYGGMAGNTTIPRVVQWICGPSHKLSAMSLS